jgi:uncharacterized protein (DUF885 family)
VTQTKLVKIAAVTLVFFMPLLTEPLHAATSAETDFTRAMSAIGSEPKERASEHDRLWRLFDAAWQYKMIEYPELATSVGYPGQNGRWTDVSLEAMERRKLEMASQMTVLQSINRASLSVDDQLNYDIFKLDLENDLEGHKYPSELMPINQLEGVQSSPASTIAQNPTKSVKDYEDILQRLKGISNLIDQNITLLEAGLAKKVTPPRITLRDVPEQIKNQICPNAIDSALLEPFKKFPADITEAEQQRLRNKAVVIYESSIVPAYQRLHKYFTKDYLPNTRESLALTDLPDGRAWYQFNVRSTTTTKLSADAVHNIGLAEVKRLRGEMDQLIAETKFQGSFQEFSKFLRTDPKFYFRNGSELVAAYRDIAKRIDPLLMGQFGKVPRLQYGVEPVPAFNEKSQTTAYYRPGSAEAGRAGVFFANTYAIGTRPKWEMEALTLHEAVPGHHLQIALAQEQEKVPEFRRHTHFTSYIEGWGLYAEGLGPQLGMYKDAYSRYGQLTYDMWRSIRLVLDTGIHSKGWTRQQAIDYFKENSSKTDHDIEVEVDRYIVWPGQALAYKIGQLTIKELRDAGKRELGDRFNIRAFHDVVLKDGALSLEMLRTKISNWIAEQKRTASK